MQALNKKKSSFALQTLYPHQLCHDKRAYFCTKERKRKKKLKIKNFKLQLKCNKNNSNMEASKQL